MATKAFSSAKRSARSKVWMLLASMGLAVLLASGVALALPSETPDQTLMVNGPVRTIEQVGNNLWVGGNFTQVQQPNGTVVDNVNNVAVFDSATGQYLDIAPMLGAGSTTTNVRDIDVYGDDVVIGGDFPGPSGTQRNLVVVDGTTGGLIRWYNSAKLQSVLAAPDLGRIYGGGLYLSAFDVTTGKLLWSRAQTFVDPSIHSHNPPAGYKDLERDGSTIWGACVCDDLSVSPSKALALLKLSTEGERDASWVANVVATDVMGISVAQSADKLYLGAGGADYIAAFSKADGSRIWKMDTSGSTQVVETMEGQLIIGGHFVEAADNAGDNCGFRSSDPKTLDPNDECRTRKGLAAYSFGGALEPNWDPALEGNYLLAWALHVDGRRLHAGGEFTTVSGIKQTNYARLSSVQDTTPPTVVGVAPADGQTEVAPEANVEVAFSEAIDPSSLTSTTFTLSKPYGAPVAASVGYDPSTKKATLDPDAPLDPKATYTATVKGGTEGVKDLSGNPLVSDELWSFTTTLPCTIVGTPSAETITGTSADDVICAGAGNDTIKALEGNDTLRGEGGTDQLHGGIGDDELDGGLGTDTANFSGSLASISASLTDGTATGEGSDFFSGVENIIGSEQADHLTGSAENDTLNGASGADSIAGLGGADALKGSGGGDTLDSRDGVKGNDTVDGGTGTDTCTTDATEKSVVGCEL
jgi:Bacterial Ig-like domain/RTX calcium-binding nonapeptide repeat (4 copies)